MRVLLINAVYGHGSTGTIIRDIEYLCEKSGIECYIASPDHKVREAKRGYIIGNIIDHKLHALLSRIHGKQAYYSHIPTWNLLHWINEIRPNIVHLHNLHSNYIHLNILLRYLAKNNIKTIITLHDCWFYTGGCFHYTAVGCNKWQTSCNNCPKQKNDTPAFFTKHSAQILADRKKYLLSIPHLYITSVSEWIRTESLKSFLKDIPSYVIHNGIDFEVFKPSKSDLRDRLHLEGKYVILGPASKWLLPINRNVLIRFVERMKPDEVLLLFGIYSESQLTYLNTLKLPKERIKTYGYTKNREELAQLYSMADCFANTTREDALSLINVEAQACGTPVVTFDQTGPKETVDNVNSFSVHVGDVNKLYDAIQKVRQQHTETNQHDILDFVVRNYDVKTIYPRYIELFKSILL